MGEYVLYVITAIVLKIAVDILVKRMRGSDRGRTVEVPTWNSGDPKSLGSEGRASGFGAFDADVQAIQANLHEEAVD